MRILTLLLLLIASGLEAQQLKWELGLFLGGANYQGDLVETQGPLLTETNIAYGGMARYNMAREWSISLGVVSGHISGSDQNFSDPYFSIHRNISFRSRITEAAFKIEWEPFGNRRYPEKGGYKKLFSPYLFTGFGYSFLKRGTDYTNVPRTLILEQVALDKANDESNAYPAIPAGGGIKIDLSKYSVLYIEAGFRKTFTDLLDGVSESGNPDSDDWYSFGGITLSRRFGLPDYDRDGIVDRMDACPRQAGVASAQGCPDADGDGVEDLEDVCPLAFGDIELNGCPDTDGDMVIDINDGCPYTAGLEKYDGCPDTDGDGIIDKEDRCPNIAGVFDEKGCPYPDTDADGVIDKEDDCPNTPGVPEEGGCPLPDTDLDGVVDTADACPNIPGLVTLNGCPDTDADGITDAEDRCPNTPGLSANEGCPEIEEEEIALLKLAMETVRFETASAILKSTSLDILNQIADILIKYPDYGLRISGHTDSQGNDDNNQTLSENRAQSCYDYFVSTGIRFDRMLHQGFGETRPIGDNITLEGRRINRRVEFELFILEKPIVEIPLIAENSPTPSDTILSAYEQTILPTSNSSNNNILDLLPQSAEELQIATENNLDSLTLVERVDTQPEPDSLNTARAEDLRPDTIEPSIVETAEPTSLDSLQLTETENTQSEPDSLNTARAEDLRPDAIEPSIVETAEPTSLDSLQLTETENTQSEPDSLNTARAEDLRPDAIEPSIVETAEPTSLDSLQLTETENTQSEPDSLNTARAEDLRPDTIEPSIVETAEQSSLDSLQLTEAGDAQILPDSLNTEGVEGLPSGVIEPSIAETAKPSSLDSLQLTETEDAQISTDSLNTERAIDVLPAVIAPPVGEATIEELSVKSPKEVQDSINTLESISTIRTENVQTPDTIYWFESDLKLGMKLGSNTNVDIELPEVYLQADTIASGLEIQAPEKQGDTSDIPVLTPPIPTKQRPTEYVPKALMEEKVETLEQRIEALEKRIRLLEQLIIRQNPAAQDSLKIKPPLKENKQPEKKEN